jgi:hypothetical protein
MKKLSLKRETLKALENSLTLQSAGGGFSGIGTCVYCNVTRVACTGTGTSGCPQ